MPEKTVATFMDDPLSYFDRSVTRMHTIPRAELEPLQRAAMARRFAEHRAKIEIVRKLTERLGIDQLHDFDDVAPLLFPHTVFKSYPASLLDAKRFDLMTKWLGKVTRYDLSNVDTRGCDSIDEWIDRLDQQTPLEVITSSGTTGTLSIIPKDKAGATYTMGLWRQFLFQTFGREPAPNEIDPVVDVIWPNHASGKLGHLRMAAMLKREFTGGDERRFHALYTDAISTDLMFLASKMRAAASRGELDRLEIDPKLLARKDEFVAMQARRPQEMAAFFTRLSRELAGKRVFMIGAYNLMYEVAAAGLERGMRRVFAPDSAILTGGGMKGFVLPANYMEVIREFLGVERIQEGYVAVEERICRPEKIEKIVAWGGFASVKHVTRYIQPGLELIALDPKRSASIIGREAFDDEATLREVALRAATDIGVANQEGCASARVIYVLCGTDMDGIAKVNRLGELVYQALLALPEHVSSKPKTFDRELYDHLAATRLAGDDWFRVIGGESREGAVIVSQFDEPVDYAPMLSCRVANLVPVDDIARVTRAVNAYTQTVGIYPESLKRALRDTLPLFGAQRLTSLGYACHVATAMPQDAIEPVRRMCKWIVDETCDPAVVAPMWGRAGAAAA